MKLVPVVLAAFMTCATVVPVVAQDTGGNVARVYVVDVRPGMAQQFQAALKLHMDWRARQNDSWSWQVYRVVNGPNFGEFIIRSGGHRWADLDAYEQTTTGGPDGGAHFRATVGAYIESFRSSITENLGAFSRLPDDLGTMRLFEITDYELTSRGKFFEAVGKIHDAIGKTNRPVHYAFIDVANGGSTDTTLVVLAEDWAGFTPQDSTISEMMIEVYGAEEASRILEQFESSVRSDTTYMLQLLPDLSSAAAQ